MRLAGAYILLVTVLNAWDDGPGAGPLVLAAFLTVVGARQDRADGYSPLHKITR